MAARGLFSLFYLRNITLIFIVNLMAFRITWKHPLGKSLSVFPKLSGKTTLNIGGTLHGAPPIREKIKEIAACISLTGDAM